MPSTAFLSLRQMPVPRAGASVARSSAASCRRGAVDRLTVPSPVMTLRQAATYLQVSKGHLSNAIAGKVPGVLPLRFFRLGRRILIKREWIDAWIERSGRKGAA